jgi:hypothetical protein
VNARLALLAALVAAVVFGALPVHADGVALGVRGGSLGIGPELTFGLGERVHLRVAATALDHGDEYTETGIDYDADLELRNGSVLLDWYPGAGSFRLSAGAVWNDTELIATAPLEELLRREIPTLPPLDFDLGTLRGTADIDPVGPYLGIGWGHPFAGGRWGFTFDLGAAYHGEPEVTLVADTSIPIGLIPGGQARLDQELAEEEQSLQEEVDGHRYLPVVSIGFTYSF